MKTYLFVTILSVLIFNSSGAKAFKKGDVLNVWAPGGLALYEKPEMTGKKLMTIPYASVVNITDASLPTKPVDLYFKNVDASKPFTLKADWVKVKYNNHEGYVINGYLSKTPCFKKAANRFEEDDAYLARNFGEPQASEKRTKTTIVTTKTYKNGIIETETAKDQCISIEFYFPNATYADVLCFEQLSLTEADAVQDVKITDLRNGRFKLSYYSCD